jgi:outer membrane protein TolC
MALFLITAAGTAEEATFTVPTAPGQQTRGQRLGAPQMRLSLHESAAMALAHNINLEVSRLVLASSQGGIVAATGIFDPLLSADFTEQSQMSASTNVLAGARTLEQKQRLFSLGLSQFLPIGTTLSLGWENNRASTNSGYYYVNPSYGSGLFLSLTQPLLRGFGTDVNRQGIEVARRNHDISRLQFEQIVIATLQQVETGYWNLVYAIDNLKVKEQSLKLAQDLLDQTRTRVRIGTSAPIDIVQSEATVAAREQEIIVAANAVEAAADSLKQLMGFEDPEDWQTHIVPTDSLETEAEGVDLSAAIETALARRLELKQRQLEAEIGEVALLAADNAVRPRVDLKLDYGYNGSNVLYEVGPDGQPAVVGGDWNDSLQQLVEGDYPAWSAGVVFSYPLGNNQAQAQRAQRRFELGAARQTQAVERQAVIADVRSAVRNLDDSAKAIAAAVKARELAERNLDAEQKKFANGMSTNYQVLEIQEDLAAAQAAELLSRMAYRRSTVAYHVSAGTLLADMGVTLEEAPAPKEPHTMLRDVEFFKYGSWVDVEEPAPAPAPAQQ